MIIVRFQGGLGNQMLQRAFMEYVRKFDDNVVADLSEYNGVSYHNGYELIDVFDTTVRNARWIDTIKSSGRARVSHYTKLGLYINSYLNKKRKKNVDSYISEHLFYTLSDETIALKLKSNKVLYFDGFWPHKYMYDTFPATELFVFKDEIIEMCEEKAKEIKSENSCSIHVRLGDYIGSEFDCINSDYYRRAIEIIKDRCGNVKFYVFSDDVTKAKSYLDDDDNIIFMNEKYACSGCDMYLMSLCNNNIIANSTFSFWGAKLNCNTSKIVVAPKQYSADLEFIQAKEEGWMVI